MGRKRIGVGLKSAIVERANSRCEYCQLPQNLCPIPFEVDHVVPVSDGGETISENLCLACWNCNSSKHDQTVARDPKTSRLAVLFNPRTQKWTRHFEWTAGGIRIIGRTLAGRATVEALRMNQPLIVEFRLQFAAIGMYPPIVE